MEINFSRPYARFYCGKCWRFMTPKYDGTLYVRKHCKTPPYMDMMVVHTWIEVNSSLSRAHLIELRD